MSGQQFQSSAIGDNAFSREINFHGAAIISEDGAEIPITEAMVEEVLLQLWDSTDFTDVSSSS